MKKRGFLSLIISHYKLNFQLRTRPTYIGTPRFPKLKNKKAIVTEYLPWLLIGLAILTILMITLFLLKGQGTLLIDKIKNLFKF